MRLIDADVLKEAIEEQHRLDKEIAPLVESISYHKLNNLIDNAPTVNVVKTVDVNDVINYMKVLCKSCNTCIECPMYSNCKEQPAHWKEVNNNYV